MKLLKLLDRAQNASIWQCLFHVFWVLAGAPGRAAHQRKAAPKRTRVRTAPANDSMMPKPGLCAIHLFPYSPQVSGGHSNAIRSFIACQRAKGIEAAAIAPRPESGTAGKTWDFPLAEVDTFWGLRWAGIAQRLGIPVGGSLVHVHSVHLGLTPLLRDLRRVGVPYVLTSHGQLNFKDAFHALKKFVYLNCLDRGPRNAAGLHLLTSAASRRLDVLLPGYRGLRLIQGNVVAVPDPAELPVAARSDYDAPSNAFLLVFMGRLDVWTKGLDLVIEAFSRLPAGRFRLVIAGPDWEGGQAKLEQLAERLGCRDRIRFVGPVYGERKWSLLRMADLFVSPARWDAFSVAHAEVLALGIPLVTSDRVTMAEDLRAADAAQLCPPAIEPLVEAICSLEANPRRRQELGRRGKAWAELNCDPDRAGIRFREFYQAVLDRRGVGTV